MSPLPSESGLNSTTGAEPGALLGDLYPFRSHYLQLDDARMHYVDEGEGRPILMLHGNPTWSFYYRNLIKVLRTSHRVIAPDHVGCGFSDKPRRYPYTLQSHIANVGRLVSHLGLEDVTLIVHDWGGPIGFGWATRHPELVRDLIVFNSAAFLQGKMPFRIRISGWPIFGEIALLWFNAFARAATRMACSNRKRMTAKIRKGYLLPYDSPAHRVAILAFVRDIPYDQRCSSYGEFQRIENNLHKLCDRPITIGWGMRDFCFTDKYLDQWLGHFPNAHVERFNDAGHYVLEDIGDAGIALVERALSRTQ